MVNVTTSDILTEERIRRVVEDETQEVLVWNEAFREINMPEDWSSDTMEILIDVGIMGEPERIQEGSEFPRAEENYDTIPITVKKYGMEVSVAWESTLFSVFDIVAQQIEKKSRRMAEKLNRLAFEVISDPNNLHPNGPVTGSGSIDYPTITDARKELLDDQKDPDMLIVNTAGENQLLNSEAFQRATELGDETVLDGAIGRIAGIDVMVDNSGLLDPSTGQGIMVDSDDYGYEVIKQEVATEEYEAPERQADIFQIYTMREWEAIKPEAAIKVEEGTA